MRIGGRDPGSLPTSRFLLSFVPPKFPFAPPLSNLRFSVFVNFSFLATYSGLNVALGLVLLGLLSGLISVYVVMRRQSLIGDVVAHAALPGIVFSFILFRERNVLVLLGGAFVSGLLGVWLVTLITRNGRLKMDGAFAIILSVFFGLGVLLMSHVQKTPDASQAGLERFLFGQASAITAEDVVLFLVMGALILLFCSRTWKEIKLFCFDPEYYDSLGYKGRFMEYAMMLILVLVIVLGLQFVGLVLIVAMIVAPGAGARQWTNNFTRATLISMAFGGLSGFLGAWLGSFDANMPTGPIMVIVLSVFVMASLILSPQRGILWKMFSVRLSRRNIRMELVLMDFYALSRQHEDPLHAHSSEVLEIMSRRKSDIAESLPHMKTLGWITSPADSYWALTAEGLEKARKIHETSGDASPRA